MEQTETQLLHILLSNTQEAWEYLERIKHQISQRQIQTASTYSEEALFLHLTNLKFSWRRSTVEENQHYVWTDQEVGLPGSSIPKDRCSRFLIRSIDNVYALLVSYEDFASNMGFADALDHCRGVGEMVQRIVSSYIPAATTEQWACSNDHSKCSAKGHFHTADKQIWPEHEKVFEESIPVASSPTLGWRDFDYQAQIANGKASIRSAFHAFEESRKLQSGLDAIRDETDLICDDLELYQMDQELEENAMFREKRLTCILANMVHRLDPKFLHQKYPSHRLAVILPGGSRTLYPTVYVDGIKKPDYVYIKMNEDLSNTDMPYSFQPVTYQARSPGQELTQTVPFVELPPELRNTIYNLVLDDDGAGEIPRKQPSLALTCSMANKEMMSLLFSRHGWVVRM